MLSYYFKSTIDAFVRKSTEEIIGTINLANQFDATRLQNKSWELQIPILKKALGGHTGTIFFEFSIPRMGKRVDSIVIIDGVVFVLEFKVGETKFLRYQIDQVWDYALDLKNFHKPSHTAALVPILIATEARTSFLEIITTSHNDNLVYPIRASKDDLPSTIREVLTFFRDATSIDQDQFTYGTYSPTPSIVEAAVSLYNSHSVDEITRNDAEAINLTKTTSAISEVIEYAKRNNSKAICLLQEFLAPERRL
jgi:hypothetical protein